MGEVASPGSPSWTLDVFLRASADVYRYISRLTGGDEQLTEDIVQETFIALMRHQRVAGDVEVGVGWLMTTARHRLIDHVRSCRREQARVERHAVGEQLDVPPIDFGTISADQVRWMLGQLPLRERVALALHTVDGLSVAEVARLLDRSVEATTSLLARARRRLRALVLEAADDR